MQRDELLKKLGDTDFQNKLLANPKEALHKAGVKVPATTEVKVVRNSKGSLNMVMPIPNPQSTELSDDDLGKLSAGEIFITMFVAVGLGVAATATAVGLGVGGVYDD